MKNSRILALSALSATGFLTGLSSAAVMAQTSYYQAQVIESKAIYRIIETSVPSRQCWEEEIVRASSRHRYRSHTPGLLGR